MAVPYNAAQETDQITSLEDTQPIEVAIPAATKKKPAAPAKKVASAPINTSSIASTSQSPYKYKIIAGTFKSRTNANAHISKLKKNGFDSFIKVDKANSGATLYKVQSGAFKTKESAIQQQGKLKNKGIDSYLTSN